MAVDPGLGQPLVIDGETRVVVGVMPEGFDYPGERQLWLPLALLPNPPRTQHYLFVIGRLRTETSLPTGRAELRTIAERLEEAYPDANEGHSINVFDLQTELRREARPVMYVLLGVVALVLLIACSNVAGLVVARSGQRRREFAVRLALGGSRWRLARHSLVEGFLLTSLAASTGLLLATWIQASLAAFMGNFVPGADVAVLGAPAVGLALILALVTGLVFGLLPVLQVSSARVAPALSERSRSTTASRSGHRLRQALVVGQVAIAVALLTAAALMLRSLDRLLAVEPGFQADGVVAVQMTLPAPLYPDPRQRVAFFTEAVERLRNLPDVERVGGTTILPLTPREAGRFFTVEGLEVARPADAPNARVRWVTPGYFRTMGIPVHSGRDFEPRDGSASSGAAIINRTLAREYWPTMNPLGRRISLAGPSGPWLAIVGVVGDVRHEALDVPPAPQLYLPHSIMTANTFVAVLQTRNDLEGLGSQIRAEIKQLDPNQPIDAMDSMTAVQTRALGRPRSVAILLSMFGVLALLISIGGIYGVMSALVQQRRQEIAIRVAVGATPAHIACLVIGNGASLIGLGVGIAVVTSLGTGRLIESLLYEVQPNDPVALAVAVAAIAVGAMLALLAPLRQAAAVAPAPELTLG